mgnify:CR=1 FL=1
MSTQPLPRSMPLHTRILLGLLVGALTGGLLNATLGADAPLLKQLMFHLTEPIGTLFLRLLLLLVVPLVFASLTLGVAGIGDVRKLGRIGLKCLGYTLVVSAISVLIGLTVANVIRPGERIDPELSAQLQAEYGSEAAKRVTTAEESRVPIARIVLRTL